VGIVLAFPLAAGLTKVPGSKGASQATATSDPKPKKLMSIRRIACDSHDSSELFSFSAVLAFFVCDWRGRRSAVLTNTCHYSLARTIDFLPLNASLKVANESGSGLLLRGGLQRRWATFFRRQADVYRGSVGGPMARRKDPASLFDLLLMLFDCCMARFSSNALKLVCSVASQHLRVHPEFSVQNEESTTRCLSVRHGEAGVVRCT
jgi:hypothetical protein